MEKQDKKHVRRVRNLIIIFVLTAIIISISTYAWFIGMRTVNVSSFDVEISSTESLLLSLDGDRWSPTVDISADTFNDPEIVYEGHSNSWGGAGLVPVSTIGAMDSGSSRMILFEKASLTSSPGGYRLMASRVENNEDKELGGYVAFDLFIRNFTGRQYIKELDVLAEEAIYLTTDSAVTVSTSGVENTGIENSVRVAFAQIGRVEGILGDSDEEDDIAKITGITCTSNDDVTGICRTAKIWEPNDRDHVKNAISWYDKSCKKRIAEVITSVESYEENCNPVIDGIAYPTYAISDEISAEENVDIYDGPAYNTYENTEKLVSYPYFTDSMKLKTGTERIEFMTLAPNSITKVRIYIYLEGQDIDNYDFASIGKSIAVKFGFTKQRYTEDDIEYEGPAVNQGEGPSGSDLTAPIITLLGDTPMNVELGSEFVDPGAEAEDNEDGDITNAIEKSGTVNTEVAGSYLIIYKVTDEAGNTATKTRTVIVE